MQESKERFITEVFTVSSTAYFDEKSHLKPSDTEIPNLRELLKSLNKSMEKKLTTEYVNEAKGVLSLIQSVQLGTDENKTKARVLEDLQSSLKKELKTLDDRLNSLCCNLEECLSRGVEKSEKLCVKTTHDMLASVRPKTNKGFHKIYRAICEREGCYWPRKWNEPIDLNKFLTKHMYDNINQEFDLMFPVDDNDKTEKSVQAQVDKFNVSQRVLVSSIEIFIKTQETKLRASLARDIIKKKKKIYSSIKTTIQQKMAPGYKRAAEERGDGCMERMEGIITETIEQLKYHMFSEAKSEALKMFNDLKLYIIKTLESELMKSVERFLSQTSNISLMDVSREIEELERLSQQLSD
ncbi:nuclear GTPase SLIP-GC-like [Misgurnus anguillicaudatus]|uniref:nuclear GTPase SLIP-GC-like n=1 Tax=Misgurnus anguillicaudatus TaxID=75329 RepID=UPI003CCF5114